MKNKRAFFGSILLVMVLAGALSWLFIEKGIFRGGGNTSTAQLKIPPPVHEIPTVVVKNMDDAEAKREKKLNNSNLPKPATIYAKVVDQSGRPVPDAKVVIASAMSANAATQNVEQTSDSDGTLSFSRKWLVLSIKVTKPGFHDLLASSATFQYAKSAFTPPPSPDPSDPVVFVLQRM
jgi:hypothetical protein